MATTGRIPKRREEGHMVFKTTPAYGRCISELAEREGLSVASFLRQMTVQCLETRGYGYDRVQAEFGDGK